MSEEKDQTRPKFKSRTMSFAFHSRTDVFGKGSNTSLPPSLPEGKIIVQPELFRNDKATGIEEGKAVERSARNPIKIYLLAYTNIMIDVM